MNVLDILLTVLLAGLMYLAFRLTRVQRKKGGCLGCGGNCAGCGQGCPARHEQRAERQS